jgi:hypothetical protein
LLRARRKRPDRSAACQREEQPTVHFITSWHDEQQWGPGFFEAERLRGLEIDDQLEFEDRTSKHGDACNVS